MKWYAPVSSVLLSVLLSCVEPASEPETVVPAPGYVLFEEPLATIGGRREGEGHVLHYAESALRISDDRIVVGDVGTRELRYFNSRGEYLRAAGGPGEGPGEFERLRSIMRFSGDTVAAWDWGLQRLNLVSPEGKFAIVTLRSLGELIDSFSRQLTYGFVSYLEVFSAGHDRLLVQPMVSVNPRDYGSEGVTRDTVLFALMDLTQEDWVEIGPFPRLERFAHGGVTASLPFGKNLRLAVGERAIFMGSTDDPRIRVRSPETGEITGEILLPVESRPITTADIEVYRTSRSSLSEWVDAVPWPSEFPIFSELKVGGDGLLWVKRFQAPTDAVQEGWGFQEAGDMVARINLSTDLEVMDLARDYVLLRTYDELDREEIRLHTLVPTG